MCDKELIDKVLNILNEEVIPAEGCTEPIALAYVAAMATKILGKKPEGLNIYVSGNMIKNVKSVVVPNSGGLCGIEVATVMGALAGNPDKEMMVISDITKAQMDDVKAFIKIAPIKVYHEKNDIKLYIRIDAVSGDDSVSVEAKHLHTNITKVIKNGKVVVNRPCNDTDFNSPLEDREELTIASIYELAQEIDVDLIKPLFNKVIECNSKIASEGLKGTYGVNIGSCIVDNISDGYYGDDQRNRCASLTAAGSDARMSGCPYPVMTTSGSGNQGMTASLPIVQYCRDNNIDEEKMIRALFLSHMSTVHIKTRVGRLSAYCGAVCASAAVSGALAWLRGGNLEVISDAIINTLGNISGLICDGAKASCAMKIATGVYSAFDGISLAMQKRTLKGGDGIVGTTVEDTIDNIGELAQAGMQQTDEVILDIMTRKKAS